MQSLFYMIILYLSIDPSLFSIIKHVPLQLMWSPCRLLIVYTHSKYKTDMTQLKLLKIRFILNPRPIYTPVCFSDYLVFIFQTAPIGKHTQEAGEHVHGSYQMWRSTGGAPACAERGAGAPGSGWASAGIRTPGGASATPGSSRTASVSLPAGAWVCVTRCPRWRTTWISVSAPGAPETYNSCSCSYSYFFQKLNWLFIGSLFFLYRGVETHIQTPSRTSIAPQDECGYGVPCARVSDSIGGRNTGFRFGEITIYSRSEVDCEID